VALKVNGMRLHTHVNRVFGGNAVAGIYGLGVNALRAGKITGAGVFNNFSSGEHSIFEVTDKAGIPNGYRHPGAWKLPKVGGALSSRNECEIAVNATAEGAKGLGGVATAGFTINADAIGGLVAGGVAVAAITFAANGAITASLAGQASATVTIGVVAEIGALAWLQSTGGLTITGAAIPFAIGHMVASTVDDSALTPAAIAAAVWAEIVESGYSASDILRILAAVAAGDATDLDGNPSFTGLDGTTTRVAGTISGGDRTITSIDGD
jgi:hypothetical protein